MDTKVIEVVKNILISRSLNAIVAPNITFTENIYVPFVPDAVVVKNVSYFVPEDQNENDVTIVSTNLVNETFLCTFIPRSCSNYDMLFPLNKPVNGTYTFTLTDVGGTTSRTGYLAIALQFIKYKEVKDQKVY